jgi:hypothetical protein
LLVQMGKTAAFKLLIVTEDDGGTLSFLARQR